MGSQDDPLRLARRKTVKIVICRVKSLYEVVQDTFCWDSKERGGIWIAICNVPKAPPNESYQELSIGLALDESTIQRRGVALGAILLIEQEQIMCLDG